MTKNKPGSDLRKAFVKKDMSDITTTPFPDSNYAPSTFDSPCRFSGQKANFEALFSEMSSSQMKIEFVVVV